MNASQASGIDSVDTPDKDHDDAVKENAVNASQASGIDSIDSVDSPDNGNKDHDGVNASQVSGDANTSRSADVMDVDDGYESANSDIVFVGISVPDKPHPSIVGRVHRSRSYKCYLCRFIAEMQVTFVDHFTKTHPGAQYKCDYCSSMFKSCNGLLKHERSHQYLRYKCDLCGKRAQFPYQMTNHYKVHSRVGLEKCQHCDYEFSCKLSKISHEKTHTTKIECDECPAGTSKVYKSKNGYNTHYRGKHGSGWISPCGQYFPYKSKYTHHVTILCGKCKKLLTTAKVDRYHFLKKIKKEK